MCGNIWKTFSNLFCVYYVYLSFSVSRKNFLFEFIFITRFNLLNNIFYSLKIVLSSMLLFFTFFFSPSFLSPFFFALRVYNLLPTRSTYAISSRIDVQRMKLSHVYFCPYVCVWMWNWISNVMNIRLHLTPYMLYTCTGVWCGNNDF